MVAKNNNLGGSLKTLVLTQEKLKAGQLKKIDKMAAVAAAAQKAGQAVKAGKV